jgi:hypothetical protein
MDLFTGDDLALLARHRKQPSVSVFSPLERGGPARKANEIRLKDLLSEAARRLADQGRRQPEVDDLMAHPRQLLEDMHFLKQDSDGLAVFVAPGLFRHYNLPAAFEPITVVSDRFHVKPLVPMLNEDGRFYVLALSQNSVRLLQCSRYHSRALDLRDTPKSLAEALRFDEPQDQRSAHSGGPTGSGRGGMVFHTQANDSDKSVHKENVHQFLHQVENGVTRILTGEKAPLVVAAVRNVCSSYGEVNTYPHLVEGHADGNPDRARDEDLRAEGWAIVEPLFNKARQDAAALYERFAGTDKASGKLHEVLRAAEAGRVLVLLTARSRQVWGAWNPQKGRAEVHDEEQKGDEDLLNRVTVEALLHGASVFTLDPEEMPEARMAAAVYRY